jgi:hypothetical protein
VVGFLGDFAERARQVGGNGGLLGNDETLHAGDEPLAAPRRISSNTFLAHRQHALNSLKPRIRI